MAAAMLGAGGNAVEGRRVTAGGVIRLRVRPPLGKPVRVTNQLNYIAKTIIPALNSSKDVEDFQVPVNPWLLNLQDYYAKIKNPMDLKTIRQRLDNKYYWSASECVYDMKVMFKNVYDYHGAGANIMDIAKRLEKLFVQKLAGMPASEVEDKGTPKYMSNKKGLDQLAIEVMQSLSASGASHYYKNCKPPAPDPFDISDYESDSSDYNDSSQQRNPATKSRKTLKQRNDKLAEELGKRYKKTADIIEDMVEEDQEPKKKLQKTKKLARAERVDSTTWKRAKSEQPRFHIATGRATVPTGTPRVSYTVKDPRNGGPLLTSQMKLMMMN